MKIAVLGCGAIGGLFLGYLSESCDVVGIVKDYQKQALDREGLLIDGAAGAKKVKVNAAVKLEKKVDIAIFATKIDDLEPLIKENVEFLKEATIVSTQNGVKADYILNKYFPKENIVTGIVMFAGTYYPPNKIVHNFKGDLIVGNIFNGSMEKAKYVAKSIGGAFNAITLNNIRGAKYLKLFVNLNNCISAVLGKPMQEVFSDLDIAKLAIELNREAFVAIRKSKIILESLPTYPKEKLEGLVSMQIETAAVLFSKVMSTLGEEPLYGSILQSIKRGKKSEIDYINGEIVRLAGEEHIEAPLNTKIVRLVHQIEQGGDFLSKEELIDAIYDQTR
ncbi:MAG: 2-dehydropantoate 2-reductase [Candidatus Omnitrophica bacterium]|nr:2-dehydropantoate 2-reductase [Candidatus Omnitrophota bacterium]